MARSGNTAWLLAVMLVALQALQLASALNIRLDCNDDTTKLLRFVTPKGACKAFFSIASKLGPGLQATTSGGEVAAMGVSDADGGAVAVTAAASGDEVSAQLLGTVNGTYYFATFWPGIGCTLYSYVGAVVPNTDLTGVPPLYLNATVIATGTGTTAGSNLFTCVFRPSGTVPIPPALALPASQRMPTGGLASLAGRVRCLYSLWRNNDPNFPVDSNNLAGGNYSVQYWSYNPTPIGTWSAIASTLSLSCVVNSTNYANNLAFDLNDGYILVCFPAKAAVETPAGPKPMSEVAIGDKVLALDNAGKPFWDEVYFLPHKDASRLGSYLTLHAQPLQSDSPEPQDSNGNTAAAPRKLVLSRAHYLTVKCIEGGNGNKCLRLAGDVVVGDTVWLADAASGKQAAVEAKIVKVTESIEQGMYSPWTLSGSIIVDGVVASTHTVWPGEWTLLQLLPRNMRLAAAQKAAAAHHLMQAPLRAVYRLAGPGPLKLLNQVVDYFMQQGDFAPEAAAGGAGVGGDGAAATSGVEVAQQAAEGWDVSQVLAIFASAAAAAAVSGAGGLMALPAVASPMVVN